jgi:hypothetical protein
MAKLSAGFLMFRWRGATPEVFIVHPGGPFWAKKDAGAWSIPKGEYAEDEDPLTRISHRSFGVGSNGAPGAVFHRPSSDIAFRREIVMLIGHRKGHKTSGKSFSFVAKPISSATPQGLRYGLRLKVLLEIEKSHFSSAGSPTPADIAPATDNWKPSRPKPCAPSPGSGRRSSAASYGSSIPVLRPVQSLSGPAASTH